jgi:cellulose synthase (UDP-forming)
MISLIRWLAWGAAGAAVLTIVSQPVSVQAQFSLATAVVVAMAGFWIFGRGPWVRQILLALGSLVVLRYVYWRSTQTLPPISEPIDFIPGLVLYAAEMYCFAILCISLIINVDPLRRAPLERTPDDRLPTVDVFVPSYNEDDYILATTIAAALSMDYPAHKLKVWLCDDGGTDQKCNDKDPEKAAAARQRRATLQKLCADLGAHYHTRARNEHAKAGNMNACLKDSDGELIVVFDADHAPFRAFLRETVGHFLKDEKLFLVQTPHVFLNPDPIEKNLKTFDRMPSENEMFYSVTQRGLDKWDGSFFCGSAAVLRRKALEQTGGFSGVTITEDCETAFELHASGWRSAYVDKPLIAGLQPETFTSFIGQRSRWCQGMFQILILKNPALKKGLSFIQRIAYLSSMTFWFFPLPRLIFMLAPLLYIFFDIKLFVANVEETIAYTLMYLIVNVMIQNYMYGRVRWPWVSELYEYVQGVFLVKAIVSVVANPRKPTFNVTAKGLTLDEDHLSELSWPFFMIYGALAVGGVVALLRYMFEPGVNALMLVVGLWNTFNMIIAGAALGAVAERKQPDRHPRLAVKREGFLLFDGRRTPVAVQDVSAGGVALATREDLEAELGLKKDREARLEIVTVGDMAQGCTLPLVMRRANTQNGLHRYAFEFPDLDPQGYFALADLMYGDSEAIPRFLAARRAHKDLFRGTAQFIRWGLFEPLRSFAYLGHDLAAKARARAGAEAAPDVSSLAASASAAQALPGTTQPGQSQPGHVSPAHARSAHAREERAAPVETTEHEAVLARVASPTPAAFAATIRAASPPIEPARTSPPHPTPAALPTRHAPAASDPVDPAAQRDPLADLVAALSTMAQPPRQAAAETAASPVEPDPEDAPIANLRRLLDSAARARTQAA